MLRGFLRISAPAAAMWRQQSLFFRQALIAFDVIMTAGAFMATLWLREQLAHARRLGVIDHEEMVDGFRVLHGYWGLEPGTGEKLPIQIRVLTTPCVPSVQVR